MQKRYDTVIIGGGPAGLTAAIYAARYQLKALVISKEGSMMLDAHKIENYPGFKEISGIELMKKFKDHVKKFDVEVKNAEVVNIEPGFTIVTEKNERIRTKTLILALGTEKRKLNVKGEEEFLGKGVSYCYVCDSAFFRDKVVGVVGGNDSAALASLLLAEYAKKVYIIYRKEKIRAEPYKVRQIEENPKIEVINNTVIKEIKGKKFLEKVVFEGGKELKLDGLFIEIGSVPSTSLARKLSVKLDENNHIIVNEKKETNVKGVYSAGDITNSPLWQIITACADGAIAANSVYHHLKG